MSLRIPIEDLAFAVITTMNFYKPVTSAYTEVVMTYADFPEPRAIAIA